MAVKKPTKTTESTTSSKSLESKKIEENDLNNLKQLQTETDRLVYSLGQLYIQKEKLSNTENDLKKAIHQIEQKEEELGKQLSSKYGVGTVNIEEGTFVPRS
jgi:multidrug resistance efflux pump|tara:strand:- start:297 stop:602 length:306 start_codon:yes stop_codon:yes gene_type:complete